VLAAAGVIAAVSVVTFGVLLNGLSSQGSSAIKARAANDAVTQAGVLDRLALQLDNAALAKDDHGYEHAAQAIPAEGRKLVAFEPEDPDRARVTKLVADLQALAGVLRDAPGDPRLDAFRADLLRFARSERGEQMELRRRGSDLRNRAETIAAVGLVVLLILIAAIAVAALRAIVVPVNRLQRFARELGHGRFDTRLPESGPPETAELARAFNASAENLQRATDRHLAELDAVFRDSPLGIAFLDLDLRFVRVNEALAQMNQVPAAEHLGRTVGEVTGQHEIERALREVIRRGEPLLEVDIALHGRRFDASYFAVRDDRGELLAVGKAMIDVTARRRAEAARERLQQATEALAGAVTVADVAAVAIEQAGQALDADTAILLLLDPERGVLEIIADHNVGAPTRQRWTTLALAEPTPSTEAARRGQAVFLSGEAELLERFPNLAGTPYPRTGAYAALPLVAYGRTLGVLSIGFPRTFHLDEDARALLTALAAQAAIAIARAQLYEREHTVSQTLQASLLPRALPEVPGLDLAGRLEAGARGVEVGGDFYDAFAISEDTWGIAIGDVCGKGVDAAALTALARHTVRAAARAHDSPAAVLEALNRAVLDENRPGQFLTAIFARLVPLRGGGFRLTVACGGHPPPVVVDAHGRRRELGCTGTLLGVVEDPQIADSAVDLQPGDALLLYTDGLTEANAPAQTLTTPEVAQLLARVRRDTAAQTAQTALASALQAGGGSSRDDIAVLVVQVKELSARPQGELGQANLRHGDNVVR
jgi:serine phosphatase RsbU (regulator of sigma subunit)/PAS domain-containing protein